MFNCHCMSTLHSTAKVYRDCSYISFSDVGSLLLVFRKTISQLSSFASNSLFAFADRLIKFPPPFLLTTWQVRSMLKTRSCFFFWYTVCLHLFFIKEIVHLRCIFPFYQDFALFFFFFSQKFFVFLGIFKTLVDGVMVLY